MTTTAMNAFLNAAAADQDLARGLAAAIGNREGIAACEAVAAYASENGYAVTAADADSARRALLEDIETETALSDEQLEGVAGGTSLLAADGVGDFAAAAAASVVTLPAVALGMGVALVDIQAGATILDATVGKVTEFFNKW